MAKAKPKPLISDQERKRRLLYSRAEVQEMLAVSQATVIRMEQSGILPPRKLAGSPNGKTFYAAADVHRVAGFEESSVA